MENHESKRVLRGDTGALYLQLPATDKENPTVDSNSSASEHTHTLVHCDGRQDLRGAGHVKLVLVDVVSAVLGTVVGHLGVV